VETLLYHANEHFNLENDLLQTANSASGRNKESTGPLATAQALKDIQQTLFEELWQKPAESQGSHNDMMMMGPPAGDALLPPSSGTAIANAAGAGGGSRSMHDMSCRLPTVPAENLPAIHVVAMAADRCTT